jgi:hypothetical protein
MLVWVKFIACRDPTPMSLTITPDDTRSDYYLVNSGQMRVGDIFLVKNTGRSHDGRWSWGTGCANDKAFVAHGLADTKEEAKARVREKWQAWLESAGLQEADADLARTYRDNLRDCRDALRLIREAIEQHAPPGSVKAGEYLEPTPFTAEAEELVKGIDAIARR